MQISTKRGDRGQTDLFDPQTHQKIRVPKNDLRLEVIGALDELVSLLGLVKSFSEVKREKLLIERVQKDLFSINSIIAGFKVGFTKAKIKFLEKEIDKLESQLTLVNGFVLPGKNQREAFTHLARSVCRRGEREMVKLLEKEKLNPVVLVYLNRLSDLLFRLASGN